MPAILALSAAALARDFDLAMSHSAGTRILLLMLLLVAAIAFAAAPARRPVLEEAPGAMDERPGKTVLFLGNSRIFVNDLPRMVRDVADSAHSPVRYDVHMRAWGAATLEEHANNDGDREALRQRWDMVILQTQSASFYNEASARDFETYGEKLVQAARAAKSPVALIANWTLGPNFYRGAPAEAAAWSKAYGETTERKTRALAERIGAGVIDLERAFDDAQSALPDIALTTDGNHPSHAGTFLAALVIYGYLSQADLANISWRPFDMSRETATALKQIAARHLH
jgi:hypothetical protein